MSLSTMTLYEGFYETPLQVAVCHIGTIYVCVGHIGTICVCHIGIICVCGSCRDNMCVGHIGTIYVCVSHVGTICVCAM